VNVNGEETGRETYLGTRKLLRTLCTKHTTTKQIYQLAKMDSALSYAALNLWWDGLTTTF